MHAYYYGFEETTCAEVDGILSAVANAGKAFHHTRDWNDSDDGEPSQIDNIQDAACGAAERINEFKGAMKGYCEDYEAGHLPLISSEFHYKTFKNLLDR